MKKKKRKSLWTNILQIHRYVGILVALFVIELAVTGILLNHTEELQLDEKKIKTTWLMEVYGIKSAEISSSYKVDGKLIYQRGSQLYLEKKALECDAPLVGAVLHQQLIVLANQKGVCLILPDGTAVDDIHIDPQAQIQKIGKQAEDNVVLDTSMGWYGLNEDLTILSPIEKQGDVDWSAPATIDRTQLNALEANESGAGLTLERVILDLHSGRIVGIGGVYFMDIVAFLMILLSITGLSIWGKRLLVRRKK